jgi:hypothetical protein
MEIGETTNLLSVLHMNHMQMLALRRHGMHKVPTYGQIEYPTVYEQGKSLLPTIIRAVCSSRFAMEKKSGRG